MILWQAGHCWQGTWWSASTRWQGWCSIRIGFCWVQAMNIDGLHLVTDLDIVMLLFITSKGLEYSGARVSFEVWLLQMNTIGAILR